MDCEKELKEQYEECSRSGYFFFVPERKLYSLMDKLLDEDVYLLGPISFKKSYFKLFEDGCSVANVSVDAEGCLGQG